MIKRACQLDKYGVRDTQTTARDDIAIFVVFFSALKLFH